MRSSIEICVPEEFRLFSNKTFLNKENHIFIILLTVWNFKNIWVKALGFPHKKHYQFKEPATLLFTSYLSSVHANLFCKNWRYLIE